MTMKRAILIAILMCAAISASAQEDEYPRYQASFGWGGYPLLEALSYSRDFVKVDPVMMNPLNSHYRDYAGPMWSTGTLSGEFAINFRKWFSLAFDVAANATWRNYWNPVTDLKSKTISGFYIHVVPQARFYWLNRDNVRMYSSIGLGFMAGDALDWDEFLIYPSAQINPLGIEVGRKVFGFCEIGAGTMFTGGMAGIGYRF